MSVGQHTEKSTLVRTHHSYDNMESSNDVMVYPNGGIVVESAKDNFRKSRFEELFVSFDQSLRRNSRHGDSSSASNLLTVINIIIWNLGVGILALPQAFKHAGLWTGFFGLMCLGLLTVYCMHMLVQCGRILQERTGKEDMNYQDLVEQALATGPGGIRKYSRIARGAVIALLVFSHLGFCSVYIIFMALNIKDVIGFFSSNDPSLQVYELIIGGVLIPFVCIKKLDRLAWLFAVAYILTCIGVIMTIQFITRELPDSSHRPDYSSIDQFLLFIGTAVFVLDGTSLVLPLKKKMKRPQDLGGWFGVLNLGMVVSICLSGVVGFYGYLKYGDNVEEAITLNLPQDKWLYLSVRLIFSVAVLILFNTQFYIPIKILWPRVEERCDSQYKKKYGEFTFRVGLLLFTAGVAIAIPLFGPLISFVGSVSSINLIITIPSILEIITFYGEGEPPPWYILVKNYLTLLVSLVGSISAACASVMAIIEAL